MINSPEIFTELFEITLPISSGSETKEEQFMLFRKILIQRIDDLFRNDFEKLKWILYRIDVSEKKLTEALKNSEADAATVMADMIIARQIEKAESRKKFGEQKNDWNFDV